MILPPLLGSSGHQWSLAPARDRQIQDACLHAKEVWSAGFPTAHDQNSTRPINALE